MLDSGAALAPVEVAYETYGELNADALERDPRLPRAHRRRARRRPPRRSRRRPGWWDNLIGPGKPLDTDRSLRRRPNLLGGCQRHDRPVLDRSRRPGAPTGSASRIFTVARPGDACTAGCSRTSASSGPAARSAARSGRCRCCSGRSTTRTSSAAVLSLRLGPALRPEHRLLRRRARSRSWTTSTSPAATTTTRARRPTSGSRSRG